MGTVLMFWLVAALFCSLKIGFATAAGHVTREHPCNFEPSVGFCGWQQPDLDNNVGESGLVVAELAPHGGPPVDANPGRGNGSYFYFFSQGLSQSVEILQFPSVQYICGLSFAYYSLGPLDLDILRKNVGSSNFNIMLGATSTWQHSTSFSYNITAIPADAGQLVFQVFEFDFGEATPEGGDSDLLLALDDVNMTFCLPCDFDSLAAQGNLILNSTSEFGITFGEVNQFTLSGSSPLCPTVPLVFDIDSVDPNHLSSIFSIHYQGETATVLVDGTGPGLDANGTSGTVTVSVHVKGSNYTHTSEPFKQTALVSFQHPPTIVVQSPSEISVDVTSSLSYQLEAISALILSTPLRFENFRTTPQGLKNDLTLDVDRDEVIGMISLSSLAEVIDTAVTPSFSVDVMNEYGGFVVHAVTVHFNPSAPLFNQTRYTFSVQEEQSSDDLIGTVAVIDPNSNEDDGVNIPFFTDPAVRDKFLILPHPQSEPYHLYDIVSINSFDYEEQTFYALEIGITDIDDSSLTSTAMVTFNVVSVNEFSPRFNLPRLDRIISDVTPVADFVAEFRATDADHGADGEIQYSISSGNEDNFFGLESPNNGTVVVKRSPILPRMYTLVITARDGGVPPRSANATLLINVTASNQVDCSDPRYGPPIISHFGGLPDEPVGAEITFNCNYGIPDPAVVIYEWVFYNSDPAESVTITMNEHYTIGTYSLTVHNISVTDAGFYRCYVENQCGFNKIHYHLRVIDYPEAPENVHVTNGPFAQNVSLAWDTPDQPETDFILKPVLGFVVQAQRAADMYYETSAEVGPEVNSASLVNLSPGSVYILRVLSVNTAGTSPSDSLMINTTATAPKLRSLVAAVLTNNSLLLEWELEFDGGYPVTNFQITIEAQRLRQRRQTPDHLSILLSPDQAEAGSLVTQALPSGLAYKITASVENVIGRAEQETNAFVGHIDSSICSFEELVDISNGGCPWQLEGGVATAAENAESPLPTIDAGSNPQGHYVYFKPESSPSEFVIMSHSAAGYVCGYSFYYQLLGDAELILRTSSEEIVWFSGRQNHESTPWVSVSTEQRVFLSSSADEELQFVLVSYGHSSDLTAPQVALDLVELEFCLPCDFELMATEGNLRLSYVNYTKIFLRTVHSIPVTVNVEGCENVLLDFTISRVVPNDLETSFSISQQGSQDVAIMVDPISADLAGSHTIGFVEVIVSVLESDYKQPGSPMISQPALIEFTLVEVTTNCTFAEHCDFDQGSCRWNLGPGVQITPSENPPLTYLSSTGSYVYGDSTRFQSPALSTGIISTNVKDDFCAVSFSYSASMVELQINVDGLRSIWSSVVVDGDTASRGWVYETVLIDLQSVAIQENRELSFDVHMFDIFGEADFDSEVIYFALDNVTLHPCIDCSTTTQECRFSSCLPGYYFSLSAESCVACPVGYYCPDWREVPVPCPPGTHSTTSSSASMDTCQTCPGNTYTLRPGSSSCTPCPQGYSCTNPAAVPTVTVRAVCPSKETQKMSLAAVVAASVGGTLAFVALCSVFCCIGCYCFTSKRKKAKEERRRKERARFLLSDESSLASTTVGRSSMASSAFDLEGRRWKRGRDASTLMSFMTDDTTNGQSNAYGDDASWTDAMELTSSRGRLDTFEQTLQNPLYTDDEEDNMIELEDKTARKVTSKKPVPASQF